MGVSQFHGAGVIAESVLNDPRRSAEFIELDTVAESFRPNFPHYLKNPMPDGVVDSHLYVACLISHMAIILLHESHARFEMGIGGCSSTYKIYEASRAILELIYSLRAGTSFDITLLEPSAVFYWYTAGRVLTKFWAVAKRTMSTEEALTLRAEVEYISVSLSVFGERIPLAREYRQALSDFAVNVCGEQLSI